MSKKIKYTTKVTKTVIILFDCFDFFLPGRVGREGYTERSPPVRTESCYIFLYHLETITAGGM